jgi:prepilin-type N-terminal cleavage/methylation domain-containing protein
MSPKSINKPDRLPDGIRRIKGFTLIELMIVLVIVGILAGIAIPRYMSSTTKAKQTEAKEFLHQIFLLERAYFEESDEYWIPPNGVIADKNNPDAFLDLGVEIMPSARYRYSIVGDKDHFIATAVADRLDDDPAIDQWQIDDDGRLQAIIDDSKTK